MVQSDTAASYSPGLNRFAFIFHVKKLNPYKWLYDKPETARTRRGPGFHATQCPERSADGIEAWGKARHRAGTRIVADTSSQQGSDAVAVQRCVVRTDFEDVNEEPGQC